VLLVKEVDTGSPTNVMYPININTADEATLQLLPGIGPAYSKRMGQSQALVHVIPSAAAPGTRVELVGPTVQCPATVASIPFVDPERKREAATDFRFFCESYFPLTFHLNWSPDHLKVIGKIERAVLHGGLFAMAMPRGSGKALALDTPLATPTGWTYMADVRVGDVLFDENNQFRIDGRQ